MKKTAFSDYWVNDKGEVLGPGKRKDKSLKPLKPGVGSSGYLQVCLAIGNKKYKNKMVHVLVCETYHGPRPKGQTCSHINGDRLDNRPENLCWESYSDNIKRKLEHGTHDKGLNNSRACLNAELINKIHHLRNLGHTHQAIADEIRVSRTTISRVLNKQRYTEVMPNEDEAST